MAAAKPRSSEGCWTCRLRRKKCDEMRPVCEGCATLEIRCFYGDSKPEWMDGGRRQKEMADTLKAQVKNQAAWRRDKRLVQGIETGTAAISLASGSDGERIIMSVPTPAYSAAATPHAPTGTALNGQAVVQPSPASQTSRDSNREYITPSSGEDSGLDLDSYMLHQSSSSSTSPSHRDIPSLSSFADGQDLETLTSVTEETTIGEGAEAHSFSNHQDSAHSSTVQEQQQRQRQEQQHPIWTSSGWNVLSPLVRQNWEQERELNFVMMYLDYIFPFLHPFYRPSLSMYNGRGWLLRMLITNKVVYHTALSLSTYFFSIVVAMHMPGVRSDCQRRNAEDLHKQQELSLRELQHSIGELGQRGVQGHLDESACAMESIIQLLYFEIIISQLDSDSWCMHLDAALLLFEQIMEHHGTVNVSPACGEPGQQPGEPQRQPGLNHANETSGSEACSAATPKTYSWDMVMDRLSPFRTAMFGVLPEGSLPYTSDQTAFGFYTSLLLYIDIVTSTVLERPPRLKRFHPTLMPSPHRPPDGANGNGGHGGERVHLNIAEVTGIEHWVLLTLSEVSSLAAWKKGASRTQTLSILELIERASAIEGELRARLLCLQSHISRGARGRVCVADDDAGSSGRAHESYIAPEMPPNYLDAAIHSQEQQRRRQAVQALCAQQQPDAATPTPPPGAGSLVSANPDVVNQIWCQATLTYLLVVVNGWQPALEAIRQSVDQTVALLADGLPSPSYLRTVVWPLCVTGCLASRAQEPLFRSWVDCITRSGLFGSVEEALRVLETVWAQREGVERGEIDFDLAKCFNILGKRSFLV